MRKVLTTSVSVLFAVLVTCSVVSAQTRVIDDAVGVQPASVSAAMQKTAPNVLAQWSSIADLPVAKQYNFATYCDGAIYTFGGINANGSGYDLSAYKYTVASGTWSRIADLPSARALSGCATVNGKIYIIGGYSNTSPFKSESAVLEYDPAGNTYTTKASMLFANYGAGTVVIQDRIFVLGGGTTSFQTSDNAIQIYDPAADSWTLSMTTCPYKSRATGVAAVGNTILYVGGIVYNAGSGTFNKNVYKGQVTGNDVAWTKMADYPGNEIMRVAAGSDGSKFYFTGGYDVNTNSTGIPTGGTYVYDPSTDSWMSGELKPTPVFYGSNFIYDGSKLYVIAGYAQTGACAKCEAFDPGATSTPKVEFSTMSIDMWAKKGTSVTATIRVRSIGGQPVTWNAASTTPWISFPKASGTLPVGQTEYLQVTLNAGSLQSGDNAGTFTVTTNDPNAGSTTFNALLHVQDQDVDTELNAFIEEFSGTWCGWCPDGVDSLHVLEAQFGDRINIVTYHSGDAMEIANGTNLINWLAVPGFPSAAVNRIKFPGNPIVPIYRDYWRSTVAGLLDSRRSPLTITVANKRYNASTKQLSFTVNVFAHQTIPGSLYLSVIEVEDSINYVQTRYNPTRKINPYFHENVVKLMVPDHIGTRISTSNFTTQTSVSKDFSFTSVDSVAEHARIVIAVHASDGSAVGEVLQSHQEGILSGATAVEAQQVPSEFTLSQNYPNPFNPSTTIAYAVPRAGHVTLTVTDAVGRNVATLVDGMVDAGTHAVQFDSRALTSGTYYVTMRAGGVVQTRGMSLMK